MSPVLAFGQAKADRTEILSERSRLTTEKWDHQ